MTTRDLACEVLVVGAGPAGAAVAARLASAGIDTLLVDRARFPRSKACAEYFSPGVVDCLVRLGVWEQVATQPHARLRGMELVAPNGQRHLLAYPNDGSERRALSLRRDDLDFILVRHAQACGAMALFGQAARCIVPHPETGYSVLLANRQGETRIHAGLLIGADGLHSTVARQLGLEAARRWPRRLGLVAHYSADSSAPTHGEMHVGHDVYCGLAPQGNGTVNVGIVLSAGVGRALGSANAILDWTWQRLPRVMERLGNGMRLDHPRGAMPLAHRCLQPYTDHAMLVGDAAGFLDPFTGEGVFRALRGAELATEVAIAALHVGDTSATFLAQYAARRQRAFRAKDALCLLIQAFVAAPRLMNYVIPRLSARREAADLAGALGDYQAAGRMLRPQMLWGLLRP